MPVQGSIFQSVDTVTGLDDGKEEERDTTGQKVYPRAYWKSPTDVAHRAYRHPQCTAMLQPTPPPQCTSTLQPTPPPTLPWAPCACSCVSLQKCILANRKPTKKTNHHNQRMSEKPQKP